MTNVYGSIGSSGGSFIWPPPAPCPTCGRCPTCGGRPMLSPKIDWLQVFNTADSANMPNPAEIGIFAEPPAPPAGPGADVHVDPFETPFSDGHGDDGRLTEP